MSKAKVKSKAVAMEAVKYKLDASVKAKPFFTLRNLASGEVKVEYLLIAAIFLLALVLRISLLPFESNDYRNFLTVWYSFIRDHGGLLALKYNIGDYSPPYVYFIAMMTYIPLPQLVLFKSLSIFFDFMLALGVYLIVKLRYQSSYIPLIAAILVLFAPTIFINSALWAQCDSIYTTFAVGGLYLLMKERPGLACFCFGLSLSFKLQAVFLLPLFLLLWMKREVYLKHLVMIPLSYVLMIFPAFLVGRPLMDLLTIYLKAEGDWPYLTLNAPNFWQWFPGTQFAMLHHSGLVLAMACALILCLVVYVHRQKASNNLLIRLAFIFVLSIPFFLPEMHERYFYMADVISIIYACYIPRQFYLAIGVQLASLLSYLPFLFNMTVVNLSLLPFIILGAMIITISTLIKELFFANYGASQDISSVISDPVTEPTL